MKLELINTGLTVEMIESAIKSNKKLTDKEYYQTLNEQQKALAVVRAIHNKGEINKVTLGEQGYTFEIYTDPLYNSERISLQKGKKYLVDFGGTIGKQQVTLQGIKLVGHHLDKIAKEEDLKIVTGKDEKGKPIITTLKVVELIKLSLVWSNGSSKQLEFINGYKELLVTEEEEEEQSKKTFTRDRKPENLKENEEEEAK